VESYTRSLWKSPIVKQTLILAGEMSGNLAIFAIVVYRRIDFETVSLVTRRLIFRIFGLQKQRQVLRNLRANRAISSQIDYSSSIAPIRESNVRCVLGECPRQKFFKITETRDPKSLLDFFPLTWRNEDSH